MEAVTPIFRRYNTPTSFGYAIAMTDACVRLALILALFPLMVGGWVLFYTSFGYWNFGNAEQAAMILATAGAALTTVLIWRKLVRWTLLRGGGTLGLTICMLVQVILWVPLWPLGCVSRDVLCMSQSGLAGGVWAMACVWLWWGLGWRKGSGGRLDDAAFGGLRMFSSTVRLTLAFALVPFLPALFFFTYLTEEYFRGQADQWTTWRAYELCAGIACLVWFLIWRGRVVWTRRRVWITAALALFLLVSPMSALLPAGAEWFPGGAEMVWDSVRMIFPLFAFAAWLAGTAWCWRYRPAEVRARINALAINLEQMILCPTCGYSLRGLREVRCPECGWAGTVDFLLTRGLGRAEEIV